ncbi:SPOR domain-containing protein [Ramlibacter sp. H39-3-26]|uniref:SPOR domain-containing protein n=1 Tax=Curvibacter soli TaxID=3031331 RepID=UPI0023DCEB94|nr:SPOR domain-containing protein [Ramlibacter sp. H39-3-26]MDF1486285.1 SPOR domain-containing protein [Ramlibacter sp. H39-3-26]
MKKQQRGGTIIGFIVGVVVGLGAALAVAVYVTKVPVPFLNNKGATRSADQEANEAQRNKDWDPNSALYGKSPARTPAAPAAPATTPAAAAAPPPTPTLSAAAAGAPAAAPAQPAKPTAAPSADPLGDLARARSSGAPAPATAAAAPAAAPAVVAPAPAAAAGIDPFDYFVQAGAFRSTEEAEAQRAKLAMMGWEAKVSEREQAGRTVFRVRVGPFTRRDDADQLKQKFDGAGIESVLVRVQR